MLFAFVLATLQSIPYPVFRDILLKVKSHLITPLLEIPQWLPASLRVLTLANKALHVLIGSHFLGSSPATLLALCCSHVDLFAVP